MRDKASETRTKAAHKAEVGASAQTSQGLLQSNILSDALRTNLAGRSKY